MFQFVAYIRDAHRQKLGQCLLRVRVRHTLNKLVNSADGVRPDVGTRVVVYHVQYHIVQGVGEMYADLAERGAYGVDEVHYKGHQRKYR